MEGDPCLSPVESGMDFLSTSGKWLSREGESKSRRWESVLGCLVGEEVWIQRMSWVMSLFLGAGSLNNRNLFLSAAAWKYRLGCYQGWGLGHLAERGKQALGPLILIPFGLNINVSHRLMCLNTRSPMNNPVWGSCQPSGTVDLANRSGSLRGIPIPDSHSDCPASWTPKICSTTTSHSHRAQDEVIPATTLSPPRSSFSSVRFQWQQWER